MAARNVSWLLLLLCCSPLCSGQRVDSLRGLFSSAEGRERIDRLYTLALECMPDDQEVALRYATEGWRRDESLAREYELYMNRTAREVSETMKTINSLCLIAKNEVSDPVAVSCLNRIVSLSNDRQHCEDREWRLER